MVSARACGVVLRGAARTGVHMRCVSYDCFVGCVSPCPSVEVDFADQAYLDSIHDDASKRARTFLQLGLSADMHMYMYAVSSNDELKIGEVIIPL